MMKAFLLWFVGGTLFLLISFGIVLRVRRKRGRVGFLHPFCHDLAGGERVLWAALVALVEQNKSRKWELMVYVGEGGRFRNWAELVSKAAERFGLDVEGKGFNACMVKSHVLVKPDWYPRFTMIGQSWGSVILAFEAAWKGRCQVLIDTTGFAFTYPVFRWLAGCTVLSYTHYPTVSTDMLAVVRSNQATYNNRSGIAQNRCFTALKIAYYRLFALAYGWAGRAAQLTMVNSNWTKSHIDHIWQVPQRTFVVYPPVNTDSFSSLPLRRATSLRLPAPSNGESQDQDFGQGHLIVSISQFRPEKNQAKQVEAFSVFAQKHPEVDCQLVLIGSCRDEADIARVNALRTQAAGLGVGHRVKFQLNVSFETLREFLGRATVGLHTMWCEHFGIGIVELQAAGVIVIAHNSGGPKSDIVNPGVTGFLADTVEEYARALEHVFLQINDDARQAIQSNSRLAAARFSDQTFFDTFSQKVLPFLP